MLHKRHNSVVTLFILLTFVGISKPARAFMLAQLNTVPSTFSVPEQLPQDAEVKIAASNSTSSINESLKESFAAKYPEAQVNIETQNSATALKSLAEGKADLVSIGRALTPEEKAEGFVALPISREKIAIVVSNSNSFDGNLSIGQFAQIFRGEITDWSELGGNPGEIKLVDLPESNDTRQAFPSYPVFQEAEFSAGSSTVKLEQDSTDAMIAELGENGVGYAVANDVMDRDDVKVITMHQTQPDDQRYPFSQPFSLVYQGTPSEAAKAYLGFASTEGAEELVANRVGSLATATAAAIAAGANQNIAGTQADNAAAPSTGVDAADNAGITDPNAVDNETVADADVDASSSVNENLEDSGNINTELNGSGEFNSEVAGSGEINPELNNQDSGTLNPGLDDSGTLNPDVEDSGEINTDLNASGESLTSDNSESEGAATPDGEIAQNDAATTEAPDIELEGEATADGAIAQNNAATTEAPDTELEGEATTDGAIAQNNAATTEAPQGETIAESATATKSRWWLWLIPLLGLSILGAMFALGGRKKSDQEPAISNIPQPDAPNGGINSPGTPNGSDVSTIGTNVSGNLGSVTGNAVGNTSKLGNAAIATGGAAIAGGATAANLLNKKNRAENKTDIDLDLDLSESGAAAEIPVNPVSEFTEQETELQVGEQSTKLQPDNELSSKFDDNTIQTDGASAAVAGGVAADSENLTNFDTLSNELILDNTVENDSTLTRELETDIAELQSEQTTDLISQEADSSLESASTVESDNSGETNLRTEFSGDFVLQEEARNTFSLEDNRIDDADLSQTTEGITGTVGDVAEEVTNPELDLSNLNLASETDIGITDQTTQAGGAAIVGGAAALSGAAAAASGFFNRDRNLEQPLDAEFSSEADTEIDAPEFNSEIDLDLGKTDLGQTTEGITGTVGDVAEEVTTPELDLSNLDLTSENDTGITDQITQAGGAAIVGGAAALGGAAAAASGFFNRDRNLEQPLDAEFSSEADTEVDAPEFNSEIDLDLGETDLGQTTEGITGTVGDVAAEVTTPELDLSNLDLASDIDTEIVEPTIQADSANTSSFINRDRDLENLKVDDRDLDLTLEADSADVDLSLEDLTLEEGVNGTDLTLEQISFDEADNTTDLNLEDPTLEEGVNEIDLTLEQISFDETDASINASFDEITFDDAEAISIDDSELTTDGQNISLDDLGFDETEFSPSSELLSDSAAEITSLSDDKSNDMNNISEWLDSLDTPKQNTDNIAEWLDSLDTDNDDPTQDEQEQDLSMDLAAEADDISFKFLEDLLDRDSNINSDS
ncbi:MAG: substrate-binding domain-containing protein [Cyanobacteria bacterium P01_A01_bin.40]